MIHKVGRCRLSPLAASLGVALMVSAASNCVLATTVAVTECSDTGHATDLRSVIADANTVSGSTVDLSACQGSTITLMHGEIPIHQTDLTLSVSGSGVATVSISGNGASRVFHHYGTGTLSFNYTTVTNGNYSYSGQFSAAAGGCIYSKGNVSLFNSVVTSCTASATYCGAKTYANAASGGGIYAQGHVSLVDSTVSGNSARNPGYGGYCKAFGGGVTAKTGILVKYSSIVGNSTYASSTSYGGGVYVINGGSGTMVNHSTISGNVANPRTGGVQHNRGGGMYVKDLAGPLSFINSTISGNQATDNGAGLWLSLSNTSVSLSNSTIAFNRITDTPLYSGSAVWVTGAGSVKLQSNLIANNHAPNNNPYADFKSSGTISISGSSNLIMSSTIKTAGIIASTADPQLGPLISNGGRTLTHQLTATSPALGIGNNNAGTPWDQRGTGFSRTTGLGADKSVDIGAVQFDPDIFANGFE